jgi:hypothetical protein
MDKIFKNPKIMGWVAILTFVLIVALIWDSYKNPSKDFYGLLKSKTVTE